MATKTWTSPRRLIDELRRANADIFTFVDLNPDGTQRYAYPLEWESVAALPITTFDHWWNRQIPQETRTGVRKAEKKGVTVEVVGFTDELVRGIQNIYNETPVRQGKPFWHYGKDFETLRTIHATFLETSDFIAAYYNGEIIGFMKLVYSKQSRRHDEHPFEDRASRQTGHERAGGQRPWRRARTRECRL